jgi:molybdopterin molybdotransferase
MIPVDEALAVVLSLARPMPVETVPLARAAGRVLAAPVLAAADQPPFDAAAMDGYAVAGPAGEGATFALRGVSRAGAGFAGTIAPGEAVRIFTGAPVPAGAERVVIQEDVTAVDGGIRIGPGADVQRHIRPRGGDFRAGDRVAPPRRLRPVDLALIAAMRGATVAVARRPEVALIATGDELALPDEPAAPDRIVASNAFALAAMVEGAGGRARVLPIARDTEPALADVLGHAAGADIVVTIGGASVGDHDLVARVAGRLGLEAGFYRVAMRPGKPLMAGRLGGAPFLGLPGNPVSAIVCGHLFLLPLIRAMLGLPATEPPRSARLVRALPPNGPRAHYMRARLTPAEGLPLIDPFDDQDSARLSLLSEATALLVRPVADPARGPGETMAYLPLEA